MTARRTVIGVRHHSPACARLVAHVLEQQRPDVVLIEGPSDMNERLGELLLPHTLPISLFTWRQEAEGRVHGVWTPFCETSPEWVALTVGTRLGATVAFIDLPAWHQAFDEMPNRYSDRHLRASDQLAQLAQARGFDSTDALWDHLFEGPRPVEALQRDLERYFELVRSDEAPDAIDGPREAAMRAEIERHAQTARHVVVICGGYHVGALREGSVIALPEAPSVEVPAQTQVGSALVPFSFKRLDSFAGYASGMPSPAWYQCLLEEGHQQTVETMMQVATSRLRSKGQGVSAADLIAARTMTEGLALVRGHSVPSRLDVLDGLASALVKDALDAPLPWSRRGVLTPGTNPMLVELVAAFSGERVGALAPGTPLPALVADVMSTLQRHGLVLERLEQRITLSLTEETTRAASQVLHRLVLIGVSGITLVRGASFSRHKTWLNEAWTLVRTLETDASIVEASRFGGTLEAAAAFALEQRLVQSNGIAQLATALVSAAQAGLRSLEQRWLEAITAKVSTEANIGELASALERLMDLVGGDVVLGSRGAGRVEEAIRSIGERLTWLLEGVTGANAPYDAALVRGLVALKRADDLLDHSTTTAMANRVAKRTDVPACLRGAALGYVWSRSEVQEDEVIQLVRATALPSSFGDFLAGLFAVAQRAVPGLLVAIDAAVAQMTSDDFFVALPSLRLAFSMFSPRDRLLLAESLLKTMGSAEVDPMQLIAPAVAPETMHAGRLAEQAALTRARRFGLFLEPSDA